MQMPGHEPGPEPWSLPKSFKEGVALVSSTNHQSTKHQSANAIGKIHTLLMYVKNCTWNIECIFKGVTWFLSHGLFHLIHYLCRYWLNHHGGHGHPKIERPWFPPPISKLKSYKHHASVIIYLCNHDEVDGSLLFVAKPRNQKINLSDLDYFRVFHTDPKASCPGSIVFSTYISLKGNLLASMRTPETHTATVSRNWTKWLRCKNPSLCKTAFWETVLSSIGKNKKM